MDKRELPLTRERAFQKEFKAAMEQFQNDEDNADKYSDTLDGYLKMMYGARPPWGFALFVSRSPYKAPNGEKALKPDLVKDGIQFYIDKTMKIFKLENEHPTEITISDALEFFTNEEWVSAVDKECRLIIETQNEKRRRLNELYATGRQRILERRQKDLAALDPNSEQYRRLKERYDNETDLSVEAVTKRTAALLASAIPQFENDAEKLAMLAGLAKESVAPTS